MALLTKPELLVYSAEVQARWTGIMYERDIVPLMLVGNQQGTNIFELLVSRGVDENTLKLIMSSFANWKPDSMKIVHWK
jgi:hypothetical protein